MNGDVIQGDSFDFVFKFVIIGDSGVGKSCIMHHFIYNKCISYIFSSQKRYYTYNRGRILLKGFKNG